jgi:hypothetical protein
MYYVSKSIWLGGSKPEGSNFLFSPDPHGGGYDSYSMTPTSTTTIWTVAKNASGSYSYMTASATSTVFTTLVKPFGTALTTTTAGPGFVFGPYTGVFAQATMSFQVDVVATTVSSQQGLITYRLWRANRNGSGASLITPTYRKTTIGVPRTAANGGDRISASFAPTSSLSMRNEYLVLEIAWGITTASGANNSNVIIRTGSGSFFKTGPYEDNSFTITGGEEVGR